MWRCGWEEKEETNPVYEKYTTSKRFSAAQNKIERKIVILPKRKAIYLFIVRKLRKFKSFFFCCLSHPFYFLFSIPSQPYCSAFTPKHFYIKFFVFFYFTPRIY